MIDRVFVAFGALALMTPVAAFAAEGGGSPHPDGVETVASGILPEPGYTVFNYNQYYTSSRFNDGNGNSAIPNFKVNAVATILRPFYVVPTDILGGAHFGVSAVLPFVSGNLRLPFGEGSDTGLGDASLQAHIGWHSQTFHHAFQVTLTAPTGQYDPRAFFNTGRNVWGPSIDYAFTWFTPIPGIEISSQFGLVGTTLNNATQYQSGLQTFADFGINYHPDKAWVVGLSGYVSSQLTDDKQNGVVVGADGFRSSVVGLGPQIGYNAGKWAILAKWQHEVYARNRSQGDRYWLQAFIHF